MTVTSTDVLTRPRRGSWGIRKMDQDVGPLVPGRIYTIGARPGNGKTIFMLTFVDNHARAVEREFRKPAGEGCFWEMPRRLLAFFTERSPEVARLSWAAMRLKYDIDAVTSGDWTKLPHGAEARVHNELEWIRNIERQGWVRFVDRSLPTVASIGEAVAEQVEVEYGTGPEIVLFDHVQRVRADGRRTKFEALADAMHLFETMAVECGCIVLLASQLRRKGDGVFDKYHPPTDEDFKGAGEIEEVSHVCIGLFRPLRRMTAKEERQIRHGELELDPFVRRNEMAVKILKHRWRGDALDKTFRLRCKGGRVSDLEGETPPDAGDAWERADGDDLPF